MKFSLLTGLIYNVPMKTIFILLSCLSFATAEATSILQGGANYAEIRKSILDDCSKGDRQSCQLMVNYAEQDGDAENVKKFSELYLSLAEKECKKSDAYACHDISRFIENSTFASEKFSKAAGAQGFKRIRTPEEEEKSYQAMLRACEISLDSSPTKRYYCGLAKRMKK